MSKKTAFDELVNRNQVQAEEPSEMTALTQSALDEVAGGADDNTADRDWYLRWTMRF